MCRVGTVVDHGTPLACRPVCGQVPLGDARQPPQIPGLLRQPVGVGLGVVEAHAGGRHVALAAETRMSRFAGPVGDAASIVGSRYLVGGDLERLAQPKLLEWGGNRRAMLLVVAGRVV